MSILKNKTLVMLGAMFGLHVPAQKQTPVFDVEGSDDKPNVRHKVSGVRFKNRYDMKPFTMEDGEVVYARDQKNAFRKWRRQALVKAAMTGLNIYISPENKEYRMHHA